MGSQGKEKGRGMDQIREGKNLTVEKEAGYRELLEQNPTSPCVNSLGKLPVTVVHPWLCMLTAGRNEK